MESKDKENIQKEISLEEEAIRNYENDIMESHDTKVIQMFSHILGEEQEHLDELKKLLEEKETTLNSKEEQRKMGTKLYGNYKKRP